MPLPSLLRNAPDLAAVCAQLRADGIAALDTEFLWMRTYRVRMGLVQLGSASGEGWALDCLTGASTAPLADLLRDASCVKILHAAQQDLEHLAAYTRATPCNVFDTALAAGFAGFPAGIGLQRLLEDALGVGLPKTETRTDWCRRPLSPQQVEYALDDVRYLAELRADLLRRAEDLGTAAWLAEDLALFDDPARYAPPDPDEVWRRVKGVGRLDAVGRAILRAVAAVRERTAAEWNLPRNWLGDDDSLVEMAWHCPDTADDVRLRHRLRQSSQRNEIMRRYAAAARVAAATPPADCPPSPVRNLGPEFRDLVDEAMPFVRERAGEIHVAPEILAPRASVAAFLAAPDDPAASPLASGWRRQVLGDDLVRRFADNL